MLKFQKNLKGLKIYSRLGKFSGLNFFQEEKNLAFR